MHHLNTPYLNYLRGCRSGLLVMVRLGSPEFADCRSLGICEIILEDALSTGRCRSTCVPAYLRLDGPTGRLLLHLDDRGISADMRHLHFPRAGFTLLHPYRLPSRIVGELGLVGGYRIGAGTYPILDDGTFTTLSVRLERVAALSLGRAA